MPSLENDSHVGVAMRTLHSKRTLSLRWEHPAPLDWLDQVLETQVKRARPRWLRSPRAGGGSRPALRPFAGASRDISNQSGIILQCSRSRQINRIMSRLPDSARERVGVAWSLATPQPEDLWD